VRWNPVYWLCFYATIPFLLVGMGFHDLLGQGPSDFSETPAPVGPLVRRDSVRLAEKHIRVHWLYITDGFYFLEFCMGVADLVVMSVNHSLVTAGDVIEVRNTWCCESCRPAAPPLSVCTCPCLSRDIPRSPTAAHGLASLAGRVLGR